CRGRGPKAQGWAVSSSPGEFRGLWPCAEGAFPAPALLPGGVCRDMDQKVRTSPIASACEAIASARLVAVSNIRMSHLRCTGTEYPGGTICAVHNHYSTKSVEAIRKCN